MGHAGSRWYADLWSFNHNTVPLIARCMGNLIVNFGLSTVFRVWPVNVVKRDMCYGNCSSVRPSVCHTHESRLNGSRYRNVLCTMNDAVVFCGQILQYWI